MKKQPSIRIAILLLIISIVWILFEHVMGYNTTRHDIGQYTRQITMMLFWVFIFVGIRKERGSQAPFSFMDGWKVGIRMVLIYSIGITLFIALYQIFINPEFYETFRNFNLEQLHAKGASEEEINMKLKEIDMSFNGSALSFVILFISSFVMGLIISAVAALVYRKKTVPAEA